MVFTMGLLFCAGLSLMFASCQRGGSSNVTDSTERVPPKPPNPSDLSEDCREGGGLCSANADCKQKCDASSKLDGLFRNSNDKKACGELTVNEVDKMFEAFGDDEGLLKDGEVDIDDLSSICANAVWNMLKIDDNGKIWEDYIDGYDTTEAQNVAYWLANDAKVFDALKALDDDDDVDDLLKKLLKEVNEKLIEALRTDISDDNDEEYFLGIAMGTDNTDAVDKAHDLASDVCISEASSGARTKYNAVSNANEKKGACMLGEVYCHTNNDDELVFDDYFEELLKEIGNVNNYIRQNLELDSGDRKDLEEVCKAFCNLGGGSTFGNAKVCPEIKRIFR